MADEIATVKIKSGDTDTGYMIINQEAFDPGSMELWYEPGTEPAVEVPPDPTPVEVPPEPPMLQPAEGSDPGTAGEPGADMGEHGRRGRRGV